MADTSKTPTLYALIVGVGKYQYVGNLSSVNDAVALKEFLDDPMLSAQFDGVHVKTLFDEEGTKVNIVDGFKNHLGQAKEGDTALFFFAGHGVREETTVGPFKDAEADGNIAGIVCVESNPFKQNVAATNTLSDKEMRYLIRKVAHHDDGNPKAHFVAIFDCCHSGGNTRSVEGDLPNKDAEAGATKARQVERDPFPARSWEGFVFHDDPVVKEKIDKGAELFDILPQGDHVMLAACREVELAWEKGGKGNFTTALVEVLKQNKGRVSYHELQTRILNRMRFKFLDDDGDLDQRQTPQFYINSPNKANRYNLFLTNEPNEMPTYGIVEYNEDEDEWRIDIGALHGVPVNDDGDDETEVDLYEGASKEAMDSPATIKTVFPTYSTLEMPWDFEKDDSVSYRGMVKGLGIPPLKICIVGMGEGADKAKADLAKKLEDAKPKPFELVDSESQADYTVLAKDWEYNVVLPYDHGRPRTGAIAFKAEDTGSIIPDSTDWLYAYLLQISKWSFLKDLQRTDVFEDDFGSSENYPIEVRAYKMDPTTKQEHPIQPKGNVFTLELTEKHPKLPVRFEVINHANKNLHVGLAFMGHTFGFNSKISDRGGPALFKKMSSNPVLLGPSGDAANTLLSSGKKIGQHAYTIMRSGAYIEADNWQGRSDFIKMVVSEVPFDIQSFHMSDLPGPEEKRSSSRASFMDDEEKETPKWEIQTFELFITNPKYKPEKQPA